MIVSPRTTTAVRLQLIVGMSPGIIEHRAPARNDDEKDDAEEDGGDGGDPDQAAHRLLELLEREGDHEGEDDRQLSEHKAINLSCEGDSDARLIEVVGWLFVFGLGLLPAFASRRFHHNLRPSLYVSMSLGIHFLPSI